jgi:hypothetical protein
MDHSVVSMTGEDVQKVRCRTCNYEHTYRKGKGGKKEMTTEEAFHKVLSSVAGSMPAGAPEPKTSRKK